MATLSVDLAFRNWSDLGIVVLDRTRPLQPLNRPEPGLRLKPLFSPQVETVQFPIVCEIIPPIAPGLNSDIDRGPVDPNILAGRLNHLCAVRNIRV